MSYGEIAEITGDSVGALKVRVHRARGLLRVALRDEAEATGEVAHLHRGGTAESRG